MRVLAVLLVLLRSAAAMAREDVGEPGADPRIRYVTYDSDDVVAIHAVVGVVTHLVLEPGEKYVTHAFGDGKAWDFAVKANHCFLKAVATNADSNLTVVTDRRSYHFALKLAATAGASPTFEVVFRYPDSDARARQEAARRRELEARFAAPAKDANLDYSMSGDMDLAPVNAWDDREFTYFKFPGNRDLPAIYMVDPDGGESIVNRHSTGAASDVVVVHRVAQRWVLRLGTRALAVWNDSFDVDGRRNTSRTELPDVNRVVWRPQR